MTKAQKQLYNAWRRARHETIWDAYARPSFAKEEAYEYCLKDMREHNGFSGRITSANSFHFSFAYIYDTEKDKRLRYHTAANVYDFAIDTFEGGQA